MKNFSILLCIGLLNLAVTAHAITCYDSVMRQAGPLMNQAMIKSMQDFFKRKGIELNAASLNLKIESGRTYFKVDQNDPRSEVELADFSIDRNHGPSVESVSGTKFDVIYSGPFGRSSWSYYKIISSNKGFDREGNPVAGHCSLKLAQASNFTSYGMVAEVENLNSGKVIGQFSLPAKLDLY